MLHLLMLVVEKERFCVFGVRCFQMRKQSSGIEYSEHLLKISKSNLEKLSASEINVICSDVIEVSLDFGCKVNLLYLYNPFDAKNFEPICEEN